MNDLYFACLYFACVLRFRYSVFDIKLDAELKNQNYKFHETFKSVRFMTGEGLGF
jgi:hypothetical protein